jgi:NTP pyrophosphatase (non-canonical NTP hydrolase)
VNEEPTKQQVIDAVNLLKNFCHGRSSNAGWWDGIDRNDHKEKSQKLLLIHSEVSEVMEGMRKGLNDDHLPDRPMEEVEMSDVLIRAFDYSGGFDLDVGGALADKMEYNQNRADHKLENRAKDGGKKF